MARLENDAYQTPVECIKALLPFVDFTRDPDFIEPCKGEGNIYNLIPCQHKYWCEITAKKDYFKRDFKRVDLIITNPPFSRALEFLQKSLSEAETVIYLLRLNFLASQKRKAFWNANRPTHIFVLGNRPSFTGNGTDQTEYAWFCWDRGNRIKTNEWLTIL
jgi:hypothetical protein